MSPFGYCCCALGWFPKLGSDVARGIRGVQGMERSPSLLCPTPLGAHSPSWGGSALSRCSQVGLRSQTLQETSCLVLKCQAPHIPAPFEPSQPQLPAKLSVSPPVASSSPRTTSCRGPRPPPGDPFSIYPHHLSSSPFQPEAEPPEQFLCSFFAALEGKNILKTMTVHLNCCFSLLFKEKGLELIAVMRM